MKSNTTRLADRYLNRLETVDKLKSIANRSNYPYKVSKLLGKIQGEYDFWKLKKPSPKLADLQKDLTFIQGQKETVTNSERIDLLMEKYGLK